MKNILTITSLFIVLTAHAQTNRTYSTVITDHLDKTGELKSKTIKYLQGTIYIDAKVLKIDEGQQKQEVYTIVPGAQAEDAADENYTTRSLYIIKPTKTGIKALGCVLLVNPKGRVTDIVIKKTKATRIDYVLN